jgi:hypothetical protein
MMTAAATRESKSPTERAVAVASRSTDDAYRTRVGRIGTITVAAKNSLWFELRQDFDHAGRRPNLQIGAIWAVGVGTGRVGIAIGAHGIGYGARINVSLVGTNVHVRSVRVVRPILAVLYVLDLVVSLVAVSINVTRRITEGSSLRGPRRNVRKTRRCESFDVSAANRWGVKIAAALMPHGSRKRWLEDIAISLYDYEPAWHDLLLCDFLSHAPAVIVRAWAAKLPRRMASDTHPKERRDDPASD